MTIKTSILDYLENPQIYTGMEINAIQKPFDRKRVNICLLYPDKYEIGMSHYGIKILYHLLNSIPDVAAERCFLPDKKAIDVFLGKKQPLFSLENKIPLAEFDLLSFSLLSELNFTNVLQILDLANLPLISEKRTAVFPIIAAGGISIVNPEPMRRFIDIFAFGDGEVLFKDILDVLRAAKSMNLKKRDVLNKLDSIKGIYVPELYPLELKGNFYCPQIPKLIKKRIIKKFEEMPLPENSIVPIGNVVFNRLDVEIARGCPQTCRFCQAKSYYSPYRIQPLDRVCDFIENALKETGFEDFSLSTLSTGDYPYLNELLEIIPKIIPACVSFSISSLRPATLTNNLLSIISLFRRTGITIVPEAGSQRLRKVINKNVTNEEIFRAVKIALDNHWQKIKLYFMIGLPSETEDDLNEIVVIVDEIFRLSKENRQSIDLHLSFSPFVPKPHTPLQWVSRDSLSVLQKKIDFLKNKLKNRRKLKIDFHNPQQSYIETILSRGDNRVGELIMEVYKEKEIYTAWDGEFNFRKWQEMIAKLELDVFCKEISITQPLPWDFLQINYLKGHLLKEYQKARAAENSLSCFELNCSECQGCFEKMERKFNVPHSFCKPEDKPIKINSFHRVWLFFPKRGMFRYFSHLSMSKYLERIIRKTGIKFKYSEGFHPRIKMVMLPPLPVYAQSNQEVAEVFLDTIESSENLADLFNSNSEHLHFNKAIVKSEADKPLLKSIKSIEYKFSALPGSFEINQVQQNLTESDNLHIDESGLIFTIDFNNNGAQRFAQIYKILDPFKENTHLLLRNTIIFAE